MRSPEQRLRRRIETDGPIPFAAFMEEALYGAGGYYAGSELAIGEGGDFVTGSSLSPHFGRATATLLAALDSPLGHAADLLEAGCGSGAHLAAVADALGGGAERRLLGWDRVPRRLPRGVQQLGGLEEIAESGLEGLIFSYELIDAQPVHRLIGRAGGPRELLVGLSAAGELEWFEDELSDPALAGLAASSLHEGQVADLSPGWRPLYRSLAEGLGRGLLVTCDYGFEAARLLDPRVRMHGTLACYRRQQVHRNPFAHVGEQDLTAHVDFSALIEEGEAVGLTTLAFTRQAAWLAACGLLDGLERAPKQERVEVARLMQLDGMGEEIRVLVQGRGIELRELAVVLPGFADLVPTLRCG